MHAKVVTHQRFSRTMTTRNSTRAPAKSEVAAKPSASQRLIEELAQPDDPFSLQFLIEQAGHTADYLERISDVLRGDKQAWLEVKIGAKTVEVVVTNLVVQHRQLSEQLRKLMYEIHRQRAALPADHDDDATDV